MVLCVAGGWGQMREWFRLCLVMLIVGETEAENPFALVQSGTKLGLQCSIWPFHLSFLHRELFCDHTGRVNPLLSCTFSTKVVSGTGRRNVKTRALRAVTPDSSWSGPRDSAGKELGDGIRGHLLDQMASGAIY